MEEFSCIDKYFKPLSFGRKEALELMDDAAIITHRPGFDLVITKDAIVEGTHFFKSDSPENIAKKLLRVNISDLAAKGAEPYCCFLALVLPRGLAKNWLQDFSLSLKEDMTQFSCFLAGGDTTSHDGPLALSLTALGYVPSGTTMLRKGAKEGDLVFVTGTIGDSYLGLKVLQGQYTGLSEGAKEFVQDRYHIPRPRVKFGQGLRGIATSAIDISDGLLAEMWHICKAGNVGAEIILGNVPFSQAMQEGFIQDSGLAVRALSGGDDYELLFTVPANLQDKIAAIAQASGTLITCLGKITTGDKVRLLGDNGREIVTAVGGYKHVF